MIFFFDQTDVEKLHSLEKLQNYLMVTVLDFLQQKLQERLDHKIRNSQIKITIINLLALSVVFTCMLAMFIKTYD